MKRIRPVLLVAAAVLSLAWSGCSGTYYRAMEKIGVPKREILVSRVEKARDAQTEAKEEFADALTQFLALTKVEPGKIKTVYGKLASELQECEERATDVRERIAAVENVSSALFKEWATDAKSISDSADRRESERLLRDTRERTEGLLRTMKAASDRMDPILTRFRDKVLLLKANLNAQAIAGLSGTAASLETDVARLVADMERAIKEAEVFLAGMK